MGRRETNKITKYFRVVECLRVAHKQEIKQIETLCNKIE